MRNALVNSRNGQVRGTGQSAGGVARKGHLITKPTRQPTRQGALQTRKYATVRRGFRFIFEPCRREAMHSSCLLTKGWKFRDPSSRAPSNCTLFLSLSSWCIEDEAIETTTILSVRKSRARGVERERSREKGRQSQCISLG